MEVNVKSAVKMFFSKSSFEMIYVEALANALDAGATEFNIHISVPKEGDWANMVVELTDNGEGFTEERFGKFKKLLEVEERTHKGLGRLVYLCYFDNVHIESVFQPGKARVFDFNDTFDGKSEVVESQYQTTGAYLRLSGFSGEKLGKLDYIEPSYLKDMLLENFYIRFYKAKLAGKQLIVNISRTINGKSVPDKIDNTSIPNFEFKELTQRIDAFQAISLYYFINEIGSVTKSRIITALAVDDRCHKVSIIADENFPYGYDMVFLLMSETFQGSTDESRQNIKLSDPTLNQVNIIFKNAIADVVNEKFPQIQKSNKKRQVGLERTFPHLCGYFDVKEIGYSSMSDVLKKAQEKYFRDQKEIVGATKLDDAQYEKSLNLSARALTEYILFRQNVIDRMKTFDGKEVEADLHNLLAPKGSEFSESNFIQDLYRNNVWVLDDKFMSYCTVLSEAEMSKVIDVLTEGEVKDNDDDRPDITIFFSGNPQAKEQKLDVVVVELKRLGIPAELTSIVEFQLDTRTQRLAEYYDRRIQRMWYYGVVKFDDKYRLHLKNNGYKPLFSNGSVYFRSKVVYSDLQETNSVIQNSYIMDFHALVEDANSRNETFLKILKDKFNSSGQ